MYCRNRDTGCKFEGTFEQIIEHEKACDFVCENCDYCNKLYIKINKHIHDSICEDFKLECEKCKAKLKRKDMKLHKDKFCPYIIKSKCNGCDNDICLVYFNDHINTCEEIYTTCQCGTQMKRKDLQNHSTIDCLSQMLKSEKTYVEQQLLKFESFIPILDRKMRKNIYYYDTICYTCEETMCDIYKKQCTGCKKYFCRNCIKKIFKNCKSCACKFCEACSFSLLEYESCYSCQPEKFRKIIEKLRSFS